MRVSDLTANQIRQLCRIFQLRPAEDPISYSNRILNLIRRLPSELKRPNRLSRLVLPSQKTFTPLCALHKQLDASLVHSVFTLVALEVGVRLNSLVSYAAWLKSDQTARVTRLRELHVLWLNAETYQKTFLVSAREVSKWHYQDDGCEACMLARIAGDLDVVLDLRVVVLSRTTRRFVAKYGVPSLSAWLEAWIASLTSSIPGQEADDAKFEKLISRNEAEGNELKYVRKRIAKERRKMSQSIGGRAEFSTSTYSETVPPSSPKSPNVPSADADFEPLPLPTPAASKMSLNPASESPNHLHDAELDIIDHYAALLSTPHLPNLSRSSLGGEKKAASGDPSAGERSLTPIPGSPSTATGEPRSKSIYPYLDPTALSTYDESVYSVDTVRNNDRVVGFGRSARPSVVREDETEEEYVPARRKWQNNDSERSKTSQPSKTAGDLVGSYQNLCIPPPAPSHTAESNLSWATASIAPSTNGSETQFDLNLNSTIGLGVAVGRDDSTIWLNDAERTPNLHQATDGGSKRSDEASLLNVSSSSSADSSLGSGGSVSNSTIRRHREGAWKALSGGTTESTSRSGSRSPLFGSRSASSIRSAQTAQTDVTKWGRLNGDELPLPQWHTERRDKEKKIEEQEQKDRKTRNRKS